MSAQDTFVGKDSENRLTLNFASKKESTPPAAKPAKRKRAKPDAKYTLEDAFYYSNRSGPRETKQAILAAAFLLEWGAACGNDDLPGMLSMGLAEVLKKCSRQVSRMFSKDEAVTCGGDWDKLTQHQPEGEEE